jgi:hypothetical protein
VNHSPKRRGYCDTAVRTGTSGTGAVRTQYVHTPGLPVTHSPGFVPAVSLIHVSLSEGHFTSCDAKRRTLQPVRSLHLPYVVYRFSIPDLMVY